VNAKNKIIFVIKLVFWITLLVFAMLVIWQIVRVMLINYSFGGGIPIITWLSLKFSTILKMTAFYGALALLICIPYLLKKNTVSENSSTEQ